MPDTPQDNQRGDNEHHRGNGTGHSQRCRKSRAPPRRAAERCPESQQYLIASDNKKADGSDRAGDPCQAGRRWVVYS
jgi:hypothetical protein